MVSWTLTNKDVGEGAYMDVFTAFQETIGGVLEHGRICYSKIPQLFLFLISVTQTILVGSPIHNASFSAQKSFDRRLFLGDCACRACGFFAGYVACWQLF